MQSVVLQLVPPVVAFAKLSKNLPPLAEADKYAAWMTMLTAGTSRQMLSTTLQR